MDIVLYFVLHQPLRIRPIIGYPLGATPSNPYELFNWDLNQVIFRRISEKVYTRASKILLDNLKMFKDFKITLSISGLAIELMEKWAPEALRILQDMVETERVELCAQTYYHSVTWLIDSEEFIEQIREHIAKIREVFGYIPKSAENTEFIYNNDVACTLAKLGFKTTVTEGIDWIKGFKGSNYVYEAYGCNIRVLLRNYRLSDDLAFRFNLRTWDQYPLTADKYASWLESSPGDVILIALDYETFGEHQPPESGIYEFLQWLPREVSKRSRLKFATLYEAALNNKPVGIIDIPPWSTISWADERDLSAWAGNEIQRIHLDMLKLLYYYAKALGGEYLRLWRLYSVSDHFYYQATKTGPAGEVHSYFNPYGSPYKAQIVYQQALLILSEYLKSRIKGEECKFLENFKAPPELCFYSLKTGVRACSFKELLELINEHRDLIEYHIREGHIDKWLRDVLLAGSLEEALSKCSQSSSKA
ncbi:MAG: glycoside hydrolase family 57 protein [Acidilobaceae archaeon]